MSKQTDIRAATEAAFHRYRRHPNEFTAARSAQLPADKNAFPKLVVLDMNHWIALARVHYGKSQDAGAAAALAALRAAAQSGRIFIPVTDINLGEAGRSSDLDRRRRLAEFMVELSGNYSLAGHVQVAPLETRNALASEYVGIDAKLPVRSSLLQWGLLHALAVPPVSVGNEKVDALLNEVLDYPELSVNGIVHALSPERMRESNAKEEGGMQRAAAVRALDQHLDPKARHLLELSNLNKDDLNRLLPAFGQDAKLFYEWLHVEENRVKFWHAVPGVDVLVALFLERDKNQHAKTDRNDGRDLSLLKVAIPYANIVFGENLWSHLANSTGLANKYGTTVTADLARVPDLLRAEGCI